jgi:hypothetical protein
MNLGKPCTFHQQSDCSSLSIGNHRSLLKSGAREAEIKNVKLVLLRHFLGCYASVLES